MWHPSSQVSDSLCSTITTCVTCMASNTITASRTQVLLFGTWFTSLLGVRAILHSYPIWWRAHVDFHVPSKELMPPAPKRLGVAASFLSAIRKLVRCLRLIRQTHQRAA